RGEKSRCCLKASCHIAPLPSKADEGGCRANASMKERDNHLC
ncbi:Os03g0722700, partial [Oryza sativa Japonica Group]